MKQSEFQCRKARLTDDFAAIAAYIHQTDPYIYPTICKDPDDQQWQALITACLTQSDNIFCLDHISVVCENDRIVGITCVVPCAKKYRFCEGFVIPSALKQGVETTASGYFDPLIKEIEQQQSGYNITNLCIDKAYRGKGAGKQLMKYCTETYKGTICLDVIASNEPAIQLYLSTGFRVASSYPGFAGKGETIPCLHMVRDGRCGPEGASKRH